MDVNQRPLNWNSSPAWHGSPDLKEEVLLRMKEHRANDEIVQGIYRQWDPSAASGYRGCFLGCTLPKEVHPSPWGFHRAVQEHYGIPTPISSLIEGCFETISGPGHFEEAADFAVRVVEAIPVGADLYEVFRTLAAADSTEDVLDILAAAPVPEPTP